MPHQGPVVGVEESKLGFPRSERMRSMLRVVLVSRDCSAAKASRWLSNHVSVEVFEDAPVSTESRNASIKPESPPA